MKKDGIYIIGGFFVLVFLGFQIGYFSAAAVGLVGYIFYYLAEEHIKEIYELHEKNIKNLQNRMTDRWIEHEELKKKVLKNTD